jgi:Ankyrin repeat
VTAWAPVRVRCGAVWHQVGIADGRLNAYDHPDVEIERELTLSTLGGPISGCAATVQAWRTGTGRLPKLLRLQRNAFFAAADTWATAAVVADLDAGFDPCAFGPGGATLMHKLGYLDVDVLLPRLLSAGLSVNQRDKAGRTPLHRATSARNEYAVAALLEAGADPSLRDNAGRLPGEDHRAHIPPSMPPRTSMATRTSMRQRIRRLLGR